MPADRQPKPEANTIRAALCERQQQLFGGARRKATAMIRDIDHDAIGGRADAYETSVWGFVNLNAFCSKFSIADEKQV